MNQNYFQNPMFREPAVIPNQSTQPPITNIPNYGVSNFAPPTSMTLQDPYAENLLEKNVGKIASFYLSYSDSLEWRDKVFTGTIEAAGRDYVLVSDPNTGQWNLLWTVYLNYVTFDGPIKID